MRLDEIRYWLKETSTTRLRALWRYADSLRGDLLGDDVHLRGLIEVSNICGRDCHYCGIRASRRDLPRYRMTAEQIMVCVHRAARLGYGTVVMQAGEDHGITRDWMAEIIRRIKSETGLAITLSLGERSREDLTAWREAGADRYLLRFETSNEKLYDRIHPPRTQGGPGRLQLLQVIRSLGYEVGSGVMIGIPGQSYDDLAADIGLFEQLDLDMIGVGPYIPHPDTPLGAAGAHDSIEPEEQVPADELTTCKVIALSRIVCPLSNIPSTTALKTIGNEAAARQALTCGANVIMPNVTPPEYRCQYQIYPGKTPGSLAGVDDHDVVVGSIEAMGRTVGRGRGDSVNRRSRRPRRGSGGLLAERS